MAFPATVYNVMIASPGDVARERKIIRECLSEWNATHADSRQIILRAVGWETDTSPEMTGPPQQSINNQILRDADLLVGVFWTRIGTPTSRYPSGSVEEIEEHIKLGKPAMLYFSEQPISPKHIDDKQRVDLMKFKESCKPRGLCESYETLEEFQAKFRRQLALKVNHEPYFQQKATPNIVPTNSNKNTTRKLTDEALTLLKEAVFDQEGKICYFRLFRAIRIVTNGKEFVVPHNARNGALWESAMKELEQFGFIEALGHERQFFKVTRKGYELVDSQPESRSAVVKAQLSKLKLGHGGSV